MGDVRVASARARILVVQVVILERALAPAAEVIVQIRPRAHAAPLAIIHVGRAVEFFVQEEGVAAQQERPEAAAIAGDEVEVVRARPRLRE